MEATTLKAKQLHPAGCPECEGYGRLEVTYTGDPQDAVEEECEHCDGTGDAVKCDYCHKPDGVIYDLDGDDVCEGCLKQFSKDPSWHIYWCEFFDAFFYGDKVVVLIDDEEVSMSPAGAEKYKATSTTPNAQPMA